MTKYSITTEQIETLNSEYATKDVIKIITDEVMTKKVEPHYMDIDKSAIENAVQVLEIIRRLDDSGRCLIYVSGGTASYCSTKCPLGREGGCGLSRAIRDARAAISALEE
jgi:hypothetical protein